MEIYYICVFNGDMYVNDIYRYILVYMCLKKLK